MMQFSVNLKNLRSAVLYPYQHLRRELAVQRALENRTHREISQTPGFFCLSCMDASSRETFHKYHVCPLSDPTTEGNHLSNLIGLTLALAHNRNFQDLKALKIFTQKDFNSLKSILRAHLKLQKTKYFFESIAQPNAIIPTNSHYLRQYSQRGGLPYLLSLELQGYLDVPILEGLEKKFGTAPQSLAKGLDRHTTKDSFLWRSSRLDPHRNYLIVDDFVTTGTTLRDAALAAQRAGARKIYLWSLGLRPKVCLA